MKNLVVSLCVCLSLTHTHTNTYTHMHMHADVHMRALHTLHTLHIKCMPICILTMFGHHYLGEAIQLQPPIHFGHNDTDTTTTHTIHHTKAKQKVFWLPLSSNAYPVTSTGAPLCYSATVSQRWKILLGQD